MSYSRQDEWLDDCQELNARIVARQKEAIAALEEMESTLSAWGEIPPGAPTDIIKILRGET